MIHTQADVFGKTKEYRALSDMIHMDVTGIALGGLQAAQGMLEKSANRIAGLGATVSDGGRDDVNLSTEAVAMLRAKEQFQANARVIQVGDQMQKKLLDLLG
jgi:hypothetical protein